MSINELRKLGEVPIRVVDLETGEVVERMFDFDLRIRQFEEIMDQYLNSGDLSILSDYVSKVVWTTDGVDTAATDGYRLYFNPLFANELMNLTAKEAKQKRDDMIAKGIDPKDKRNGFDFLFENSKCFIFVLVHECYHQLYRHIESEKMFPKTANLTPITHDHANICQDIEINRDIESDFTQFAGCTLKSHGRWETDLFPTETWTEIYNKKYGEDGECKMGEDYIPPSPTEQPPSPPVDGGDDGNDDSENEKMHAPEDYKKGWDAALAAIKANKIDPNTFQPLDVDPNKFDHKIYNPMAIM